MLQENKVHLAPFAVTDQRVLAVRGDMHVAAIP
jgi:hypothetical protein